MIILKESKERGSTTVFPQHLWGIFEYSAIFGFSLSEVPSWLLVLSRGPFFLFGNSGEAIVQNRMKATGFESPFASETWWVDEYNVRPIEREKENWRAKKNIQDFWSRRCALLLVGTYHISSHLIKSYHISPHFITSYQILSNLTAFYHILSHLIHMISYHFFPNEIGWSLKLLSRSPSPLHGRWKIWVPACPAVIGGPLPHCHWWWQPKSLQKSFRNLNDWRAIPGWKKMKARAVRPRICCAKRLPIAITSSWAGTTGNSEPQCFSSWFAVWKLGLEIKQFESFERRICSQNLHVQDHKIILLRSFCRTFFCPVT